VTSGPPSDGTPGEWTTPGSGGPAGGSPSPFRPAGPAPGPRPAASDPYRPAEAAPPPFRPAEPAADPYRPAEPAADPYRPAEAAPPPFRPAEPAPDPYRGAEPATDPFGAVEAAPDSFDTAGTARHSFRAGDIAGPGATAGGAQPADDLWVAVPRVRTTAALVLPMLVGAAVAVALGVYGRLHDPAGQAVRAPGFSSALTFKVWLTTGSAALAVVQVLSALAMYGRLPALGAQPWLGALHRNSGRLAFLLAVPVAVHCLYALGFQTYEPRVLVHSLVGCLFFGAFTVKMLALSRDRMAGWVLPLFGGLVFTALVVLWLTSSLWFFTTVGVRR